MAAELYRSVRDLAVARDVSQRPFGGSRVAVRDGEVGAKEGAVHAVRGAGDGNDGGGAPALAVNDAPVVAAHVVDRSGVRDEVSGGAAVRRDRGNGAWGNGIVDLHQRER